MLIDNYDISILLILYNLKPKEEIDPYKITKKVYKTLDSYQVAKKCTLIINRLKKLSRYGIIKIDQTNKTRIYELQMQNIEFKRMRFKKEFKKVICLKVDGVWGAFEINSVNNL